ncbi:MAG: hypothetical protein OEZ58_00840 [Gammaproteobacteria bacterium]|nr:hypothetical protein [Gammaproteobacteria bacterium]MDH5727521.1 hypothetical protein [Gammaproteobacteria bacterium]
MAAPAIFVASTLLSLDSKFNAASALVATKNRIKNSTATGRMMLLISEERLFILVTGFVVSIVYCFKSSIGAFYHASAEFA